MVDTFQHMENFRKLTGASSVMMARAAQWNCSVFRREGLLTVDEVIKMYLKCAVDYDNVFTNTKYCVQMMLRDRQETPLGKQVLESKTTDEIWYRNISFLSTG